MQPVNLISISFSDAGLDYVRRVLGTRPYDEVASLIDDIKLQVAQHQLAEPAKENGPEGPFPKIADAA